MSTKRNPLFVVVALAGLLAPGCVTASQYYELEDELARNQEELAYMRDTLEKAEVMLTDVELDKEDIAQLQAQLAAAQQQKSELLEEFERFRTEHGILSSQGITTFVNSAEGLYGYRAEGDVLFSSGSSKLTDAGKSALDLVVSKLHSGASPIRIDGHTDTDPVNKTKDQYPSGNIELGAKRAIAVRQYLIDKGIDADRLSIASFAEYKPVMAGKNAEAKAKNRRVEIMLRMASTAMAGN